MSGLAISTAWVGLIGTVVGGVLGFTTSWLVHRLERAERTAERSRGERRDLYAGFMAAAEDSLHKFQWIAEGHVASEGLEVDTRSANFFYDQEVTPRLMTLRIVGAPAVVDAAGDLRHALNNVRKVVAEATSVPIDGTDVFIRAHNEYRRRRDAFIDVARDDLADQRRGGR